MQRLVLLAVVLGAAAIGLVRAESYQSFLPGWGTRAGAFFGAMKSGTTCHFTEPSS